MGYGLFALELAYVMNDQTNTMVYALLGLAIFGAACFGLVAEWLRASDPDIGAGRNKAIHKAGPVTAYREWWRGSPMRDVMGVCVGRDVTSSTA